MKNHRLTHVRKSDGGKAVENRLKKPAPINPKKSLRPSKCDMCEETLPSLSDLQEHKEQKHGVHYAKCELCSTRFTQLTSLRQHMSRCKAASIPGGDSAQNRQALSVENRLKKPTTFRPWKSLRPSKCNICEETLPTLSVLLEHKEQKHGVHYFKCDLCSTRFTQSYNLKRHMSRCKAAWIPVGDSKENRQESSSQQIKEKKIWQKGPRYFKCLMCLYWFRPSDLEKHLWNCKAKRPCLNRIDVKEEIREILEEPNMIPEEPNLIPGEPNMIPEEPNMIPEEPNMIRGEPNMIRGNREETNMIREEPNMIRGEPNMIRGEPNMIRGEPNMIREEPNMIREEPNMIREEPNMIRGEPNMIRGEPNMIRGEPNMES